MQLAGMNDPVISMVESLDEAQLLPIAILVLFILIFLTYALMTHFRLKRKVGKVDAALEGLAKNDPVWSKERLLAFTDRSFHELMDAWSKKDRDLLADLLSNDLNLARGKILDELENVGQINVIDSVVIKEILFVDVQDFTNDEFDRFTVRLQYEAVNFTKNFRGNWEEPKWGENLDANPEMESRKYVEFWTYVRHGDSWKLHRMEKEWKEGNYLEKEPILEDEKYEPPKV